MKRTIPQKAFQMPVDWEQPLADLPPAKLPKGKQTLPQVLKSQNFDVHPLTLRPEKHRVSHHGDLGIRETPAMHRLRHFLKMLWVPGKAKR